MSPSSNGVTQESHPHAHVLQRGTDASLRNADSGELSRLTEKFEKFHVASPGGIAGAVLSLNMQKAGEV